MKVTAAMTMTFEKGNEAKCFLAYFSMARGHKDDLVDFQDLFTTSDIQVQTYGEFVLMMKFTVLYHLI